MIRFISITVLLIVPSSFVALGQGDKGANRYHAGFKTLALVDSSRVYKPNTAEKDRLHYRPIELDIWYPSSTAGSKKLTFGELFQLYEQRANQYQDSAYTGLVEELAQFYALELGLNIEDGKKLLLAETNSYANIEPSKEKFPLIIYMAGFNGMGFENFKILERLAERGFIVVSVWSVGRYPGNMTNHKLDMMQQVYDAEFVLDNLESQDELAVQSNRIGVLGCSWGGMSAAAFASRNPFISTFVSLDGTETHYFGESEQDDASIRDIHDSKLLNPETKSMNYLYLESNGKLDEFSPTGEYHYYKKLRSGDKYYVRFLTSNHADFTSIPSTLRASNNAMETHNQIVEITISFFEWHLLKIDVFRSYYDKLSQTNQLSVQPFNLNYNERNEIIAKGRILDAKTGMPLAYVNIGVLNKETGTVSNENGNFKLQLMRGMEDDTVRISMIGYKAKSFTVKELLSQKSGRLELEEDIRQLTEVTITAKGLKKKNLGNKTTSKFVSTGFGYDQLGAEMGIRINVKQEPTFVDAFNFSVSYNRLSAKALFRLNIYDIESGRPFKNIMTQNVIIPINPRQTGLISVDLAPHNIVLRNDVIVTLEWVKNEGENNKGEAIFFSLGLFNSGTLLKRASQGRFKKFANMGVGMNFDVRY